MVNLNERVKYTLPIKSNEIDGDLLMTVVANYSLDNDLGKPFTILNFTKRKSTRTNAYIYESDNEVIGTLYSINNYNMAAEVYASVHIDKEKFDNAVLVPRLKHNENGKVIGMSRFDLIKIKSLLDLIQEKFKDKA